MKGDFGGGGGGVGGVHSHGPGCDVSSFSLLNGIQDQLQVCVCVCVCVCVQIVTLPLPHTTLVRL